MRFNVEYYNRKTGENYWRTVDADAHNEAMKKADRYIRKGFIRLTMIQIDYKTA